jgi:hypothetical protein
MVTYISSDEPLVGESFCIMEHGRKVGPLCPVRCLWGTWVKLIWGAQIFKWGSKLGTMGCTQQIIPALYQFQYPVHTWLIPAPKTILDPSTSNQAGIKVLNQTQYQDQVDIRVWKQTQYQEDRAGIEILKAAQYQDQASIFNSWYPSNTNLYTTVPTAQLMFGSLPNIYLFIKMRLGSFKFNFPEFQQSGNLSMKEGNLFCFVL